jgi:tryptophan-rich sensory protein
MKEFVMKKQPSLAMFILLVMGGGIAIGVVTAPGDWYANLEKPFFNPPNWIFAPVWTV